MLTSLTIAIAVNNKFIYLFLIKFKNNNKRQLHPNVQGNTMYNGQDMEAI